MEGARRRQSAFQASSNRRQSLTTMNLQKYQESLKERTAKFKAEREERKGAIGPVHKRICDYLAHHVMSITPEEAEEHIIDSQKQMDLIEDFMKKGGKRTLLVYVQMCEPPALETGRSGQQKEPSIRAFVTDCKDAPCTGKIVFFHKKDVALNARNCADEMTMQFIDLAQYSGAVLPALREHMQKCLIPSIEQYENWGPLKANKQGLQQIDAFRRTLRNFENYLASAQNNIEGAVTLKTSANEAVNKIDEFKVEELAKDADFVKEVEVIVLEWSHQIEQVLAESSQMRKEADDIGPLAELEHWQYLTARFNSFLEQLKQARCKNAIAVLVFAKSKVLNSWKQIDMQITDHANEATDNVRYLSSLEAACEPLYGSDPTGMIEHIPNLIKVISNIYQISRYYNTSQRMTSILIKVTNQMVTACNKYITDSGKLTVWEQDVDVVQRKIKECILLHDKYIEHYEAEQLRLKNAANDGRIDPTKQFDFSEIYIFGKFENFVKRVTSIKILLETIEGYRGIAKCHIDGIDSINASFNGIVATIRKKRYDVLDHRKTEFNTDYKNFRNDMDKLEQQLINFMDSTFDKLNTIEQFEAMMDRFRKLDFPCLRDELPAKYEIYAQLYKERLESIQREYNDRRVSDTWHIPQDWPKTPGIVRQMEFFLHRITQPMQVIQANAPHLIKSNNKKYKNFANLISMHNKLGEICVEWARMNYLKWAETVDHDVRVALHAPILFRDQKGNYWVNFDPKLDQIHREAKYFKRIGEQYNCTDSYPLTKGAEDMLRRYAAIRTVKIHAEDLIRRYTHETERIPRIFQSVLDKHLRRVKSAMNRGLLDVTWSSLIQERFFKKCNDELDNLTKIISETLDIKHERIDTVFAEISSFDLIEIDEEATFEPAEFLNEVQKQAAAGGVELEKLSQRVEDAVYNLIKAFAHYEDDVPEDFDMDIREKISVAGSSSFCLTKPNEVPADEKGEKDFPQHCLDILTYFRNRCIERVVTCLKNALELIKKRIVPPKSKTVTPILRIDINLAIPNIVLSPPLDELQQTLNKATKAIVDASISIKAWNQHRVQSCLVENEHGVQETQIVPISPDNLDNWFTSIRNSKDIVKNVVVVNGAVNSFRESTAAILKSFNVYQHLWEGDQKEIIQAFIEGEDGVKPTLSDYKAEINKYVEILENIDNIDQEFILNSIALNAANVKLAFSVEAKNWKFELCKFMHSEYRNMMNETFNFVDEVAKKLTRPIKDLEDVRYAMDSLKEIRDNFTMTEASIPPIEEAFALLTRFEYQVDQEEINRCDSIRYAWKKCRNQAETVQSELEVIQPKFLLNLQENVEIFKEDMDNYEQDYSESGPMAEGITPDVASERLAMFQSKFDTIYRRYDTYNSGEQLFGLAQTEYPAIHVIKKELGLLQKLYGLYNAVMDSIDGYYDLLWVDVDTEAINAQLLDFQNRCRKLPKALKEWQAFNDLSKRIADFSECCPLLELMSNKAMKQRHWDRIEAQTNHKFDIHNENFSLRHVMAAPLLENKDDLEDICISSVKENEIEAKLNQVIAEWSAHEFEFTMFKTRGELLLTGGHTTDIVTFMEDSLMILSSLMSNRYNAPFKPLIQQWVSKLSNSNEIIESWLIVQNLWVYLEAVFVGGDIAKQLPDAAKRFANIDKSWVKIMARAKEMPNVVQCCVGNDYMSQLLPHLSEQLECCQKSLTGYLEAKRLIFPRFFFISDPALLEILGQASDSHTIQAHLLGIFENVASVEFNDKDYNRIDAVLSREGEKVPLDEPVMAVGNVEDWIGKLLILQQQSLHSVIRFAANDIMEPDTFELLSFIDKYPAQVGLLGIQMIWTKDAEEALNNARFDKKIMSVTNQRFLDLLTKLIDQTTHDLSKFDRIKYETLVTIHVHQRDIFNQLTQWHIKTPLDFEWLKQARFYFDPEAHNGKGKCLVSITDVDFEYQNEFLGCTDRLVITPLTDRCYITLAQALGMALGGAPAGPAGTGKTETTKDMAKALGKYCVVFNCSDQMDFRGLGRIYKGLAQSGSWGCFDEFNRIELPVLSVAAQQIYIVLQAKKHRSRMFIFTDGDEVSMNPEFGLFITMNPGYAGRQELPENLKVQFRSVAMMVPDRQIIKRVKLASCGFNTNEILARKFFVLYKLCEEQLTKQVHYDFGLRNILSVLRTLGAEKRKNPEDTEERIVLRVLRDMNLSKFVDEDVPLFLSLISDLFPGIQLGSASHDELQALIQQNVEKAGDIVNHPSWNLKVIQLYETQLVRHGIMTLGPTGTGKTRAIRTLMGAFTDQGRPHRELKMNPKAITAPQMFGRLDVATNDWTDGIFSTLWRRSHRTKKGEFVWIILDGPVDAIWIENLNSVLDDNKTLTLANGDRLVMAPCAKLVFEVHNIDNASPATVSRMGMIFLSSSALDWTPILDGWLNTRKATESGILRDLFHRENVFTDLLTQVYQVYEPKMKLYECNYIVQATNVLSGLIPEKEDKSTLSATILERLFIFALMWSIGSVLELEDRAKMEAFLKAHPSKLDLPKIPGDTNFTIFEYVCNIETGEWEHWNDRVLAYDYPTSPDEDLPDYSGILIPNVDNTRTNFLIDIIASQGKSVLLIGEQGTGKTVMVQGYCKKYDPEVHVFKSFNFSSATEPHMFQNTIESLVDKRVGTTYGPPGGRKMTVFIDDVNMPVVNEWGDQITNEIVRQMMEQNGMFSLIKPGDFTNIVDIQFIAAMIHPGGGRNDIPERLKSQFVIFNCTLPADNSIDHIFRTIATSYFSTERGFSPDVHDIVAKLVPTTRLLWQQTKGKMLPTPAKFHYVFNLRDLSRIWQTVLNVTHEECNSVESVVALWKHECTRVIADRFTCLEDKAWFENAINDTLKTVIPEDIVIREEPFFVDFLREAPEPTGEEGDDADLDAPKIYEEVPSLDFLLEKLHEYMRNYNENVRGANMDLVFFKDAMVHLVKISRIIRTPQGNALLVGVGGSGKQSLTKLASYIAGYKVFQITLTRSYNVTNLMDDLRVLYRDAGQKGQGWTFILTDNEIKDEGFLEPMNNLISSGEISGLFARDEIDEICGELIAVMKKVSPKTPPTQDNLYEFFVSRARANLHVVLCFSPVGEKFQARSLKFPGLFSGCTMDWFTRWPKDALVAVSSHFLGNFDIKCTDEVKQQLIETMGSVHDCVQECCLEYFDRFRRTTHVTPKSYLSFLEGYTKIYKANLENLEHLAYRMGTGLDKLVEAGASVDQLSKELEVKKVDLEVASIKTNKVLEEVAVASASANKVKEAVMVVKERAQNIVDSIQAEEAVANEKLAAAEPALKAAEDALNTIKAADIATVRKLGKPPHLIMRVMDCILILFGNRLNPCVQDPEKDCPTPSWGESLKMMSQSSFLSNLLNFNKDTITDEMIEMLEPYFRMEDFTLESAMKVSGSVAGLLSWAKAMASFYSVNKEVIPLKMNLAAAKARLAIAQKELDAAQAELDAKEEEAAIVQAKFDAAMAEKQALEDDAASCMRRMSAATALIEGLSGEKIRWTAASKSFQAQINRLVGDVLLATGFLSYTGPFNQEFRQLLIDNRWRVEMEERGIPFTEDLNITDFLIDQTTVGEWALQGLPSDDLSVQNGLIVTKASRYPLLIDPQLQGKSWIKNREKKNDLMVTNLENKYFRTHLEDALSIGRPLLIEDVGEALDPALDNVLEKNFIKSGSRYKVKVGDKECDVMDGFVLYITTKLPNPKYTPEVSARTSIIDFTVTSKGLEDQLLGRVILTEKAELEAERVRLMEEVNANKKTMKQLEDNLLMKLTSTKGSLVDDESLIIMLNTTKKTAGEVSEKLQIAHDTNIKINIAREEFRPVATRGSILYFLITKMQDVNVMYQTSLYQFLEIFDNSMHRSTKSPVNQKRIANIIEYLTFAVHEYTARSLYEEHKLLFVLLMTLQIDLQRENIKFTEFQTFIKGGAALDMASAPTKPPSLKWIQDMNWLNLVQLKQLPEFREILNQIIRNDKSWKQWWDTDAPEDEIIPDGYNASLDTFRKLLLIRSMCLDRSMPQALRYISDSLGARYADPVLLNLETMLAESTIRVPMVCLLSMGSDPTNQICDLARKMNLECRCISMGQGQEIHARRLLNLAREQGGWVLLQNCHLGLEFMEELLEFTLTNENPNPTFRVWITVEPHPQFSITLLQSSIKFTNEPPQGIRAGLKRTFSEYDQDYLDINNLKEWKPLIYAVAFLHTTVQERRKFGPIGWNIPYEFNSSDQSATMQFIQNHLDDLDPKRGIQWATVRYMIGEVQYGGRVTDDFDKRLLNTYALVWFSQKTFEDSFNFYKGYIIPKYASHDQVMGAINGMSPIDSPEAFGLHPNADITYQTRSAGAILSTIVDIQPKDAGAGGGETREEKVYRMADEMLAKLPADFIPHEVKARLKKMGEFQSLNIFLKQEIDRMQRVISRVRITLIDLKLAIEGTIIMSENLKDALDNMFDARVPALWKKISWDASTLGFWFTDLVDRDAQFRSWCFDGRPKSFWMTGFFNPQGFLTAMRQEVTRMHKGWALDSVTLANDVTKHNYEDINEGPKEGVYVHGLFLDGANWDRKNNCLADPLPKVLNVAMPVIHVYAINSTAPKDPALYQCPTYKKPQRTDLTFISSLYLKSKQPPSKWVLRGVALLCDIK